MVSIKQASLSAVQFAMDSLGTDRTANIRLEEVESGIINGREYWFLTLSMIVVDASLEALKNFAAAFSGNSTRTYTGCSLVSKCSFIENRSASNACIIKKSLSSEEISAAFVLTLKYSERTQAGPPETWNGCSR